MPKGFRAQRETARRAQDNPFRFRYSSRRRPLEEELLEDAFDPLAGFEQDRAEDRIAEQAAREPGASDSRQIRDAQEPEVQQEREEQDGRTLSALGAILSALPEAMMIYASPDPARTMQSVLQRRAEQRNIDEERRIRAAEREEDIARMERHRDEDREHEIDKINRQYDQRLAEIEATGEENRRTARENQELQLDAQNDPRTVEALERRLELERDKQIAILTRQDGLISARERANFERQNEHQRQESVINFRRQMGRFGIALDNDFAYNYLFDPDKIDTSDKAALTLMQQLDEAQNEMQKLEVITRNPQLLAAVQRSGARPCEDNPTETCLPSMQATIEAFGFLDPKNIGGRIADISNDPDQASGWGVMRTLPDGRILHVDAFKADSSQARRLAKETAIHYAERADPEFARTNVLTWLSNGMDANVGAEALMAIDDFEAQNEREQAILASREESAQQRLARRVEREEARQAAQAERPGRYGPHGAVRPDMRAQREIRRRRYVEQIEDQRIRAQEEDSERVGGF